MRARSDPRDEQRRRAQWNTSAMIAAIKPNVASQAKAPISDATILRNLAIGSGGARREGSSKTRATLIRKLGKRRPVSKKSPATHPTAGITAATTLTPAHFPDEQRSMLRAVALAYRRACRARAPSEGG